MSLLLLETLLAARGPLVLCTVMQVKGSAPRHAGSWMLAGPEGLVAGSVGGGKGESLVLTAAREALADGKARVLEVEMQGNEAEGMDMICGGTSRVLVELLVAKTVYEVARDLLLHGERAVLARRFATGETFLMDGSGRWVPGLPEDADPETAHRALDRGKPVLETEQGLFYDPLLPPEKLLILGGGHVGRALASAAQPLGFAVTVADDRPEFLVPQRYPAGVATLCGGYAEIVDRFPFDASTYVVIVTRGHRADLESLRAVLERTWRYAGLIGSRRKVRLLTEQVLADGYDRARVESVHTPIGLDIGAETPEELAVSIAGELVAVRRGATSPGLSGGARRNAS